MDSFIATLEQIKGLNSDQTFEQLFQFFGAINSMDCSTVIAAYQAAEEFCRARGEAWYGRGSRYRAIRMALVGRMVAICNDAQSDNDRKRLASTFIRSTGVMKEEILPSITIES